LVDGTTDAGMRERLARWLRAIADRLHPEHEIIVHIRPVLVGEDDMSHTLKVLTQVEAARLGLPPEWPADKRVRKAVTE
jgi:hypothetical protein